MLINDNYAKAIEAALTRHVFLLQERKAMRELLARAAGEIAGLRNELGAVVGGRIDPTEVERDIKAALTADN